MLLKSLRKGGHRNKAYPAPIVSKRPFMAVSGPLVWVVSLCLGSKSLRELLSVPQHPQLPIETLAWWFV